MSESDEFSKLSLLVAEMAQLEIEEEDLELKLNAIQKKRRVYEENFIPTLMDKLDMENVTTRAGIKVEVVSDVRASFPKDESRQKLAEEWLKGTGDEGILKYEFKIKFSKGDTELAALFSKLLVDANIAEHALVEQGLSIHPQTLLAFLRERLRNGADVPNDVFGVFVQRRAKIKRGK